MLSFQKKKNYHQENNHSCNDAFFPENNLLVSLLNTFHSLLINLSYHREGPFLRSGSIFDFITGISVCNWMFPSVSQSLHWGFLTLSSVGYKNAPPRNQKTPLVIKFYIDSLPPCCGWISPAFFRACLTHAIVDDKFLQIVLTLFIYREDFCVKTSLLNVDILPPELSSS